MTIFGQLLRLLLQPKLGFSRRLPHRGCLAQRQPGLCELCCSLLNFVSVPPSSDFDSSGSEFFSVEAIKLGPWQMQVCVPASGSSFNLKCSLAAKCWNLWTNWKGHVIQWCSVTQTFSERFARLSRCRCSSSCVPLCNACSQGALHWRCDACQATCSLAGPGFDKSMGTSQSSSSNWKKRKKLKTIERPFESSWIAEFSGILDFASIGIIIIIGHVKLQVAPGDYGQWVLYLCPLIGPDAWLKVDDWSGTGWEIRRIDIFGYFCGVP